MYFFVEIQIYHTKPDLFLNKILRILSLWNDPLFWIRRKIFRFACRQDDT